MRTVALLGCLVLAACATTSPASIALSHGAGRVDVDGSLALSDGAPVASAELRVRCGAVERTAATDERGRFLLRQLPERECWLTVPAAGLTRRLRANAGLLSRLDVRLAPMHRLALEWSEASRSGTFVLDETIPHALRVGSHAVSLAAGTLVIRGATTSLYRPLMEIRAGAELGFGPLKLRVISVERRPWLPLALRRSPIAEESVGSVTLLSPDGQLVQPALGVRTLVLSGSCEQLRVELIDELEAVAVAHASAGLRVMSILTDPCPAGNHAGRVLLGGPEARWAFGTRPGELALLDAGGRLVRRLPSVEEARVFLARSWPPFAAALKVSVAPSPSVREAEADRLLAQARAKERSGKHGEAHQLLDELLQLSPDLAEARKQRALLKAKLGDLSGALRDVTWWRSSFGADSADDLQEELEQTARLAAH